MSKNDLDNSKSSDLQNPQIIFKISHEKAIEYPSWTQDEYIELINGIRKFGENWKEFGPYIPSRSYSQIVTYGQECIKKLKEVTTDPLQFIKDEQTETIMKIVYGNKNIIQNSESNKEGKETSEERKVPISSATKRIVPEKQIGRASCRERVSSPV